MYFRRCLFVILFVFLVVTTAQAQTIQSVEVRMFQDKDLVALSLGGQQIPELNSIEGDKPRLYVDLHSDHKPDIPAEIPGTGRFIKQVRTAFHPARTTFRVVIDLVGARNFAIDQAYYLSEDQFVVTISER